MPANYEHLDTDSEHFWSALLDMGKTVGLQLLDLIVSSPPIPPPPPPVPPPPPPPAPSANVQSVIVAPTPPPTTLLPTTTSFPMLAVFLGFSVMVIGFLLMSIFIVVVVWIIKKNNSPPVEVRTETRKSGKSAERIGAGRCSV